MGDAKNKENECITIDFLVEQLVFLLNNQFSGCSIVFSGKNKPTWKKIYGKRSKKKSSGKK